MSDMNITIVIFAKSVKLKKHCVAGKVVNSHQWIRPVSNMEGAELSDQQCSYKNPDGEFKIIKPLQKIEMNFSGPAPLKNQPENRLISGKIWQQKHRIEENEISSYLDTPASLWDTGDKVIYSQIENGSIVIDQSLYLIQASGLQLYKKKGKRRATFSYAGIQYDLAVTDPNFDKHLEGPENQQILCVSLAEKFIPTGSSNYSCYKIVTTIL